MEKQTYEEPKLETIRFSTDVIATSTGMDPLGEYYGIWGEDPYE